MPNVEQNRYEHAPITTPEQVYDLAREVVEEGKSIWIFNDFDETISQALPSETGFAVGDDPRKVRVHPEAGKALHDIVDRGGHIGVITNRGGADAAEKLRAEKLHSARIIGTYGWEEYIMHENSADDVVNIDDRFKPYAGLITEKLNSIRTAVYREYGYPSSDSDDANIIIPVNRHGRSTYESGPLIIQQKGKSEKDGFPLGLANIYNFNIMLQGTGDREKLKQLLEKSFIPDNKLFKQWGMGGDGIQDGKSADPEKHRFSRGFEPLIKEGKAFAMVKLVRGIQTEEQAKGKNGQEIGLIYFGGDSNADAEAIRAARLLEFTSQGKIRSVGIWAKGSDNQNSVRQRADLPVNGVGGNAQIMQGIAEAMK